MVWVKVNQTGVAPVTIVYKGLRGIKICGYLACRYLASIWQTIA